MSGLSRGGQPKFNLFFHGNMDYRRIIILCVIVWVGNFLPAQTLHFVFFGDTDDDRIGEEAKLSYNYFKNELLPDIRENTSLTVRSYFYIGSNCTRENANTVISTLATSSSDAIFFYYDGHGYNNETNDFPSLGLKGGSKTLLSIYNGLKEKPHRLLVTMAAACNKLPQRANPGIGDGRGALEGANNIYRSLFQKASGDYMFSSSKKNEYSWVLKGKGDILRLAFDDILYENERKSLTWPVFLDLVSERCSKIASEHNINQHPQWISGTYRDGASRLSEDIYIRVDNNSYSVSSHWGSDSGSETFDISTNAHSYNISLLPSWCKVKQKTSSKFTVEYEENSGDERSDYFYVNAIGSSKKVKVEVRQDAGKRTPSAEIDKVWTEQHVSRQFGYFVYDCLVIHVNFVVRHLKDEKITCIAYFFHENGNRLMDFNGQFRTVDGQVSTGDTSTSDYEDCRWKDFTLVIPYSELHVAPNMFYSTPLKYCVSVFGPDGTCLAQSDYVSFTY